MGAGRVVNASEPVVGGMTLSREWARGHLPAVSSYANLAVITASGDSMVPTFADGDILLVDRGVGEVKIDAIYVIGRGDELFVKRIQRRLAGGELVVRSDNPLFEPESIRGPELDRVRILRQGRMGMERETAMTVRTLGAGARGAGRLRESGNHVAQRRGAGSLLLPGARQHARQDHGHRRVYEVPERGGRRRIQARGAVKPSRSDPRGGFALAGIFLPMNYTTC
jgi:hypothetical protein